MFEDDDEDATIILTPEQQKKILGEEDNTETNPETANYSNFVCIYTKIYTYKALFFVCGHFFCIKI